MTYSTSFQIGKASFSAEIWTSGASVEEQIDVQLPDQSIELIRTSGTADCWPDIKTSGAAATAEYTRLAKHELVTHMTYTLLEIAENEELDQYQRDCAKVAAAMLDNLS